MKKCLVILSILFLFIGNLYADVIDIVPIPTPSNTLQVRGINDNDIIVGLYNNGNGHEGFICDKNSNCTYHQLEHDTYFTDINNDGIVSVYNGSLYPKLYNTNTSQYTDINLNISNTQEYEFTGLNDDLVLVGRNKTNDLRNHGLIYYNNNFISFDYEDYFNCKILKINNMGEAIVTCNNSPTQLNTSLIIQIDINPLSYTIIQEIDLNSIVPYSIDNGLIRAISDSRMIYGTYLKDNITYVFKYDLNNENFEILFDSNIISFNSVTATDVNNIGDVIGTYSNQEKGFIYRQTPSDITVNYNPNVFNLIVKDDKTRLVTSGWLDPLQLNVEMGQMVNVEMTVRYKNIGPNGEDVVIQYDGVHVVEGNILIKN